MKLDFLCWTVLIVGNHFCTGHCFFLGENVHKRQWSTGNAKKKSQAEMQTNLTSDCVHLHHWNVFICWHFKILEKTIRAKLYILRYWCNISKALAPGSYPLLFFAGFSPFLWNFSGFKQNLVKWWKSCKTRQSSSVCGGRYPYPGQGGVTPILAAGYPYRGQERGTSVLVRGPGIPLGMDQGPEGIPPSPYFGCWR